LKRASLALPLTQSLLSAPAGSAREIAFTFDDPKTASAVSWKQIKEGMLEALSRHRVKAYLFVCGMRVDSGEGKELISAWDRASHGIANHSYSHRNLNDGEHSLSDFQADALKCEPLIRDYKNFVRSFRFPFFKEGDTLEKRDGMRSFLKEHGYRIGRATIDASDWAINIRLEKAKSLGREDLKPYRDFYLDHIWDRARYYDSLAQPVLGKPVRHTVLLHHNLLNGLFLGDLAAMFVEKGWKLVDATYAYADPVYERQPNILPAGESLIWALAKESGKFERELRYPGEDDVYENPKMDALKL
jgi:peptidoglycan/xylan/chitin deacetylase (PgdA/CDA1 family)